MKKLKLILIKLFCTLGCTHQIETQIRIKASRQKVWDELINLENYPSWNPFIRKAEGELKEEKNLKITVQPVGGKEMSFSPTVITVIPEEKLAWKGQVLTPGIFTGQHEFILEEKEEGTLFTQREDFFGLLVPFINLSGSEEGFEKMNLALKDRLESSN